MSDDKNSKVDDAFKQLDGALCIWARAKGEQPLKQYFEDVSANVKRVIIGDNVFQMVLTEITNEDK